jgi:transposase
MPTEPIITTERVDDIPILLTQLEHMGVQELLDKHFPTHGNWQGQSLGSVAVIWLAYILSQADHRLNHVQAWVAKRLETLRTLFGEELREFDASGEEKKEPAFSTSPFFLRMGTRPFWGGSPKMGSRSVSTRRRLALFSKPQPRDLTDDRLEALLRYLNCDRNWYPFEEQLSGSILRVYVTNQTEPLLSLKQAVRAYRDQYLTERGFARLKGFPLSLTPIYLQREDHVTGLIRLLSIGLRVLTLLEFQVRRSLQQDQEKLAGLYIGNPQRETARPTAELLLAAFKEITLLLIEVKNEVYAHLTALCPLQQRILVL